MASTSGPPLRHTYKPLQDGFPLDLTLRIFTRVAELRGTCTLSLTCRHWSELYGEAQETVRVRSGAQVKPDVLLQELRRYPNLKHLHLNEGSLPSLSDDFLDGLGGFRGLATIRITARSYLFLFSVTHTRLSKLFKRCPMLRDVQLGARMMNCHVLPEMSSLKLERLELWNATFHGGAGSCILPSESFDVLPECGLQHLKHLTITLNNDKAVNDLVERATNLVELHLALTNRVSQLPAAVSNLSQLRTLCLSFDELIGLEALSSVTSLRELQFVGRHFHPSPRLFLPEIFSNLQQLERVSLDDFTVNSLPLAISQWTRLSFLHLDLRELERIEFSFCKLTRQSTLQLHSVRIQHIPDSFTQLTRLTWLSSSTTRCFKHEHLECLSRLQKFTLQGSTNWQFPPWEGGKNLPQVQSLEVNDCRELTRLHLALMPGLRTLKITSCRMLTSLRVRSSPPRSFQHIEASKYNMLPDGIQLLEGIRSLSLQSCEASELPSNLPQLPQLQSLSLGGSRHTRLPHNLGDLTSLSVLEPMRFPNLEQIPESIGRLTGLTLLELRSLPRLMSLPASMQRLGCLEVIADNCPRFRQFAVT